MAAIAKPFQLLLAGQSTVGSTKADIVELQTCKYMYACATFDH